MAVTDALSGFPKDNLPLLSDSPDESLSGYWKPVPDRVEELLNTGDSKVLREWRSSAERIARIANLGAPDELLESVSRLAEAAEDAGILGGVSSAREWQSRFDGSADTMKAVPGVLSSLAEYEEMAFWEKVAFVSQDNGPILESGVELLQLAAGIEEATRENLEYQRKRIRQDTSLGQSLKDISASLHAVIERLSPPP